MQETALITGASHGLGRELARVHASRGRDVIMVAWSEDQLKSNKAELENAYGVTVWVIVKDLNTPAAAEAIYQKVTKAGVEPEYLINNAGFGEFGLFHATNREKEKKMINLDITVLTELSKLFGTDMVQRGKGRILNVASVAAFLPGPWMSVYYACKSYVLTFSESIAQEWEDTGVTVTALCPGIIDTEFQERAGMEESKAVKDKNLPGPGEAAKVGYEAMEDGKRVQIPGLGNRVIIGLTRFMPRILVASWVARTQGPDSRNNS